MKKIAATLLCLCLMAALPLTVFAQNTDGGDARISAKVPGFHKITVISDGAEVFVNGTAGNEFTVERLSKPTITFNPQSGKRISKVLLNGEDVTTEITDGTYTLKPIYEDKVITVTTEGLIEPPTTQPTTENPSTTEPDTTEPATEKPTDTPTATEPTTNPQSGDKGGSSTGGNDQGTNPVKTGQTFNIALWIVLMISFVVIITLSKRRSKKEN